MARTKRAKKDQKRGSLQTSASSHNQKTTWSKLSKWWNRWTEWTKRHLVAVGALIAAVAVGATQIQTIVKVARELVIPSNTSFRLIDASDKAINVAVENTGGNASTLIGYRLSFSKLPIENRSLRLVDEDSGKSIIPAQSRTTIRLTAAGLRPLPKDRASKRFTKDEIMARIPDGQVTLAVDVEESSDSNGKHHTRRQTFSANRILTFIEEKVPDYGHP